MSAPSGLSGLSAPIRHFLRDDDISADEQHEILELAAMMKVERFAFRPLYGPRSVAVIFGKPSTRTRVSFSAGVAELGGHPLVIEESVSQLSRGELVADTVRTLSRQVAAIVWRTFDQSILDDAATHSSVPVVNALSNQFHPCQVLADLLTMREHFGDLAGRTVTFLGDTRGNVAQSTALGAAMAGMQVVLASPAADEFRPPAEIMSAAQQSSGSVTWTSDPVAAVHGADVVATDTWHAMDITADQHAGRLEALAPYQLNATLLRKAPAHAIVMHCLPAHRGDEIDAWSLDNSGRAVVWQQAENRLHVQKALLTWLLTQARTPATAAAAVD